MNWHKMWEWLKTWQGAVPAVIAVVATIYYGPRKMLETWDWYHDRFWDNEVYFVISRRKIIPIPPNAIAMLAKNPPSSQTMELPFHAKEIADYIGRSEKSVQKSIKRLRKHGKIEPYQDGWKLRIAP